MTRQPTFRRHAVTTLLFAIAFASFAAAESKKDVQPAKEPAETTATEVTDEALDAALAKAAAAKVGETDFRDALQSVAAKFPLVDASAEPGKGEWSEVKLNARGKRVDAIRLRTPAGEKRDLVWAFTRAAGLDRWYIMPVEGEMKGFTNFWKADAAALFGKDASADLAKQTGYVQSLNARNLEPDKEYLVWFTFKDEAPAPTWLTVSFLPTGKSSSQAAASKAMGLPRTPATDEKN